MAIDNMRSVWLSGRHRGIKVLLWHATALSRCCQLPLGAIYVEVAARATLCISVRLCVCVSEVVY